jgi:RNA polymerase sigma-70 factor (ECF subfamily)
MDGAADDPATAYADREELERAFLRLPSEQRAAIVLQYYRDLTLPEIAEILQVPIGTVRSRIHYAKRALRAAIEADARPPTRKGNTA